MKTILITGAGRGIGYSLPKLYIQSNFTVIAISRNTEQLKSLKANNLKILPYDLVNEYDLVLKSIDSLNFQIDILINNAGVLINKSLLDTLDSDINYVIETNLIVPFKLIRDLFSKLNYGSHIVNIGSMGGF